MTKIIRPLLIFFIFLLFSSKVFSYAGEEKYSFLKIPQGAKPTAMGGAFVAMADDPSGIYYNPAGLSQMPFRQFYSAFTSYLDQSSITHLAIMTNYYPHYFGFSLLNVNYGAISETSSTEPFGTGKTYSPNDLLATITYSIGYRDIILAGINLNLISENLGISSSSWQSMDVGMICRIKRINGLSLGASYKNLTTTHNLPQSFRVGALYKIKLKTGEPFADYINLTTDVDSSFSRASIIAFGAEYLYQGFLALRCGINNVSNIRPAGDLSFGVGFGYSNFKIDTSYVSYKELGDVYRVALNYEFW